MMQRFVPAKHQEDVNRQRSSAVPAPAAASFDQFVVERIGGLLRVALNLTGDRTQAEDLVQETLLRALKERRRIAAASNPSGYLTRMLVNEFLQEKRRAQRDTRRSLHLMTQDHLRRVTDEAAAVADHLDLKQAIRDLPPMQRAALVLRFYLDLSTEEIAELMGIDPSTVRSNLTRGRRRLRQHIQLANTAEAIGNGQT